MLLAAACLLPFLNKPFLIDDPYFLTIAQQVIKHPTHPMDFTLCQWNISSTCAKAYQLDPGDALMGYVLVPTVLGGAHEWMAHLTQLVLCWIAIVAMASLVLRSGWDRLHAMAGALLLAAIPPFLPMASTAMPDVLAMACALVAMERLAAWKAEQKWGQAAMSAVALGLAGFARPHLVLLLPLAAVFLLESIEPRKIVAQIRKRAWLWSPVVAGCGVFTACVLGIREHNLAIDPPHGLSGWGHVPVNLTAYLLYLTFPMPLAACWLIKLLSGKEVRAAMSFVAVVFGIAVVMWFTQALPMFWPLSEEVFCGACALRHGGNAMRPLVFFCSGFCCLFPPSITSIHRSSTCFRACLL